MSPIELRVGHTLTLDSSERFINDLSIERSESASVLLDLSRCVHIDIGAGYELGNALRRFSHRGGLAVLLPSAFMSSDFSGDWFLTYTRSGLGSAIAFHASTIASGDRDIAESVREYYASHTRESANNYVYVQNVHEGSINVEDVNIFARDFRKWLPEVNANSSVLGTEFISDLVQLCFEAIQNIFDHATRAPLPRDVRILSYFSMRYYKSVTDKVTGPLKGYLKRVSELDDRFSETPGFLEIVINDDGVGISARQTQICDIYWKPHEEEQEALIHALRGSSSLKLRTKDAPIRGGASGLGYIKILQSLRHLGGFASLRTGRFLVCFDGLARHYEGFRLVTGASAHGLVHGYLPGTSLQLVIPLIPPEELTKRLF